MDVVSTPYFFVAYLIGGLVLGTAANVLAGKKGLSRQRWGLIGFVGGALFVLPGIVVVVVLALKPRLEPSGAQPPQVQESPARPSAPVQPPQPASSAPQFQTPPTLQMPVGPPPAPESGDAPPQGPQFQTPPTLQMPVGPQSTPSLEAAPPLPPAAAADARLSPYNVDAQGVDDSFRPNGSYDQVWFGMMTGTQVAARVRGIDNLPGHYDEDSQEDLCPVTVFFRRGEHDLEISLVGQDQWRCAEPPLGVPDRFDTTEMADWVERAWVSLEQHRPQPETPDASGGASGGGGGEPPPRPGGDSSEDTA